MTTVAGLLEEIERAPQGPEVGAFFDFDGTLIAGYSAGAFYQDRIRRFEPTPSELIRDADSRARDGAPRRRRLEADGDRGRQLGRAPRGGGARAVRPAVLRADLGHGVSRGARARCAHARAGHTVVLASSATRYQLAALAEDLEIEHVLVLGGRARAGVLQRLPSRAGSVGVGQGDRRASVRGGPRRGPRGQLRVRERRRGCGVPRIGRSGPGAESRQPVETSGREARLAVGRPRPARRVPDWSTWHGRARRSPASAPPAAWGSRSGC